MLTQLIRPFINAVNAFDPSKIATIPFNILGGAIITSYTYNVYDANSVLSYTNTIQVNNDVESVNIRSFDMAIPANTLNFNQNYKIQVIISNPDLSPEITSLSSNYATFTCYKTPTFTVQYVDSTFSYVQLNPNTEINSDKIFAQLVFNTNYPNSPALLNSATIKLYGILHNTTTQVLIFEGKPLYNEPLTQTITGMISISEQVYDSYNLEVSGVTADGFTFNGISTDTGVVTAITKITSNYTLISNSPQLRVSNLCNKGLIQINSSFTDYSGTSNPKPPTYISNMEIDLTDPTAWVKWQNYFTLKQPYTLRLWGRNFNANSVVVQMLTSIINQYAQINYINDGTNTYLTLESFNIDNNGQQMFPYYIESNKIASNTITAATQLFIGLQQSNNLYEVYLQVM